MKKAVICIVSIYLILSFFVQLAYCKNKVIYGTDDRVDVYEETDQVLLDISKSVCSLMYDSQVVENGDGTYTIITSGYTYGDYYACPDEPFGDQPTVSWCSGFLVGDDLIATAGHCYSSMDIADIVFVFGFIMEGPATPVTIVDSSDVYKGVEIVSRKLYGVHDYAIIKVDRPVNATGAFPLSIRKSGRVPAGAKVGVMGHPYGLPLKIAFGSETEVKENNPIGFFTANLDTYGGNSGSPVFNAATLEVEGILVRGNDDFILDDANNCFYSNVLPDDYTTPEEATKTTTFVQGIPGLCSETNIQFDPPRLRFNRTVVGECSMRVVKVTHNSDCTLMINGARTFNRNFIIKWPRFPQVLDPGKVLSICIEFCPVDSSVQNGSLLISTNSPTQEDLFLPLSGRGIAVQ